MKKLIVVAAPSPGGQLAVNWDETFVALYIYIYDCHLLFTIVK